jgi:hypothetical protein
MSKNGSMICLNLMSYFGGGEKRERERSGRKYL